MWLRLAMMYGKELSWCMEGIVLVPEVHWL
jgi:hypothetical protein